jgi:hypothetical protein
MNSMIYIINKFDKELGYNSNMLLFRIFLLNWNKAVYLKATLSNYSLIFLSSIGRSLLR